MVRDGDPTAHAELRAIRAAVQATGELRLTDCHLYVTLEPCPQCAGAIVLARIGWVIYAARDPKAGAFGSVTDFPLSGRLNHVPRVTPGMRAEPAAALLRAFFAERRNRPPTTP